MFDPKVSSIWVAQIYTCQTLISLSFKWKIRYCELGIL